MASNPGRLWVKQGTSTANPAISADICDRTGQHCKRVWTEYRRAGVFKPGRHGQGVNRTDFIRLPQDGQVFGSILLGKLKISNFPPQVFGRRINASVRGPKLTLTSFFFQLNCFKWSTSCRNILVFVSDGTKGSKKAQICANICLEHAQIHDSISNGMLGALASQSLHDIQ